MSMVLVFFTKQMISTHKRNRKTPVHYIKIATDLVSDKNPLVFNRQTHRMTFL